MIAAAGMCSVNYAEVVSHFVRPDLPASDIDATLDPLPIEILAADKDLESTPDIFQLRPDRRR